MAKVLKVVVFVLAITGARAQSPVPVSSLPTADSLGQNDFFPIIQGGHYHKAFIYQLPRLAQPPGQILYGTGGGIGSDTSFTWNPITGLRAYYHYRGGAIGLGNLTDVLGVDSAALLYGSNSAFINSKNTFI